MATVRSYGGVVFYERGTPVHRADTRHLSGATRWQAGGWTEKGFFIDNLLVRVHRCFWCTGLAPWEFESPFPGSLISFLEGGGHAHRGNRLKDLGR